MLDPTEAPCCRQRDLRPDAVRHGWCIITPRRLLLGSLVAWVTFQTVYQHVGLVRHPLVVPSVHTTVHTARVVPDASVSYATDNGSVASPLETTTPAPTVSPTLVPTLLPTSFPTTAPPPAVTSEPPPTLEPTALSTSEPPPTPAPTVLRAAPSTLTSAPAGIQTLSPTSTRPTGSPTVASTSSAPTKGPDFAAVPLDAALPPDTLPLDDPIRLRWSGVNEWEYYISRLFSDDHYVCRSIQDKLAELVTTHETRASTDPVSIRPLQLDFDVNCHDLYTISSYGTGNYITMLYLVRLAARVWDHVSVNITCTTTEEDTDHDSDTESLVLPWFTGYFPPRPRHVINAHPMETIHVGYTVNDSVWACDTATMDAVQLSRLSRDIQSDFRRLTLGLVGLPSADHSTSRRVQDFVHDQSRTVAFALDTVWQRPLPAWLPVSNQTWDDAVIHFRCGDLMDSNHGMYSFVTFDSYTRDISPAAQSIGIVTQPFASDAGGRAMDGSAVIAYRCRTVVEALVAYLHERHADATVTVHNGPSETMALAHARVILANQSVGAISSFGIFPIVATFGTGYWHQPMGSIPNAWVAKEPHLHDLLDNVHVISDPPGDFIMVADLQQLWQTQGADGVLAWFRGETRASVA